MGRGIRIYPEHLTRVKEVINEGKYTAPKCPSCDGPLIPKTVSAPFTKGFQNLKFWCPRCKKWRQTQDVIGLVDFLMEMGYKPGAV